mgnify:CR=1 FL=1
MRPGALSAALPVHDLSHPEYDPPDAPAWVKETVPAWVMPFRGKNGMSAPWRSVPGPFAPGVRGLDRYQANQFVCYRPETAKYLYTEYTPLEVHYREGTLP